MQFAVLQCAQFHFLKEVQVKNKKVISYHVVISGIICLLLENSALAENWKPIDDAKVLNSLFSDTAFEATLKDGVKATATYNQDGTGELKAWGDTFARSWEVKGNDQVCIGIDGKPVCFAIEQSADTKDFYRAKNIETGEQREFTIRKQGKTINVDSPSTAKGGAVKPSANEIAAELANPNTPMATLTFKLQYRQFDGDLPGAAEQTGTGLVFQPSLPFPLDNGDKIIFRPGIPFQFDQPVFDSTQNDFESESGLGDIGFDLIYAPKSKDGMLYGAGLFTVLPTATEDSLGQDVWTLGPEVFIGKATKKYVMGALPSHVWDIGGPGEKDVSLTTLSAFYVYLPGGGWNVGTAPIMSYDHEAEQSVIPVNFNFGKTVVWSGRPWKLSMEFNYFVEKPDSFAQDWYIGFNIAPVVENPFVSWFK